MKEIKYHCKNCNKEFNLSKVQISKYLKNPDRNFFCSKSCSALFNKHNNCLNNINHDDKGRFIKKEYKYDKGTCKQCGKKFELSTNQQKRLEKDSNLNIFCSKSCSAKYSNSHRNNNWKETKKKYNKIIYDNENYVNKEQISKTLKNNYFNDLGFNSENYKQRMIEKYGVENIANSNWMINHNLEKYGTEYYFQSEDYRNKMKKLIEEDKFNLTKISKENLKIKEKLEKLNLNVDIEYYLKPYYYDLKINDTLIEIDPTCTHNVNINIFNQSNDRLKDKEYHLRKTENAIKNNYRCIHIFDWDDKNKIINSLCNKTNIYARNCIIKEMSKKECNEFLNKYHYQNSCKGNFINLGLFFKNELIEVMTFGFPRYNKRYEYELLRLCTKFEYNIIGGSEKLFDYFIKQYNPSSIISYCDKSKFTGNIYYKLGFKNIAASKPVIHWYNIKTKRHITDNLLRQRGFSQLHGDKDYKIFDKGLDNNILMLQNNYLQVYDCGQITFVYNK